MKDKKFSEVSNKVLNIIAKIFLFLFLFIVISVIIEEFFFIKNIYDILISILLAFIIFVILNSIKK